MAVDIVLDGPREDLTLAMRRKVATWLATALLVVGLIASIAAVPSTFGVVGLAVGALTEEEDFPPPDFPTGEVLIAWAISAPLAFFGIRGGLRLLRHRRGTVLFLRRFGHDEAREAVSYVVGGQLGSEWRVVTLDDQEVVPIGVASGTRRTVGVGSLIWGAVSRVVPFIALRVFPATILVLWAIAGLEVLRARADWRQLDADGTLDTYTDLFASFLSGNPPFDAVALSLPGVFALAGIVAMGAFVVLGVMFVALLIALPLAGVLFFISESAEAVRRAEQAKARAIGSSAEIDFAVNDVRKAQRRVFAPRLLVMTVAHHIWQMAVVRLAEVSTVVLVDISEPSTHLLWELETLTGPHGPPCVLVAHQREVTALTAPDGALYAGPEAARWRAVLDGREVLAYTTDRRGMQRFARSLGGRLARAGSDAAAR